MAACAELVGVFAVLFDFLGVPELCYVHTYYTRNVTEEWKKGGS